MKMQISEKSKAGFEAACKELKMSPALPDVSLLRPDLGLYITAVFMLAVIIEAEKGGEVPDITDHSVRKYEPWHYAQEGYEPGSSGGGFSLYDFVFVPDYSIVGARLSSLSGAECRANAEAYPDLWEIFKLNVR